MQRLSDLIHNNRDWLGRRGLSYARKRCLTKDRALPDATCEQLMSDLSESFIAIIGQGSAWPAFDRAEGHGQDSIGALGRQMASQYCAAGAPLSMLLGLLNVWRESCTDLILKEQSFPVTIREESLQAIAQFSDCLESALTEAWMSNSGARDHGGDGRQLLRAVMNAAPDILLIKDRDSVFLEASAKYAELMGRPVEEIIGATDFDIFPEADAHAYRAEELKVIESGQTVVAEHLLDTPVGPRWFEAIKSPLRDEDGNIIGILSTERDITERVQAQQALAHERDLLNALMDNIPDCIYFKNQAGRFTRINKAQAMLLGCDSVEEAVGKTDFDFFMPEHAEMAYADEQRIIATGEPLVGKVERAVRADGRIQWNSTTKAPLIDANGQVYGMVGISRNIDDLIKAQAERDEQRRMLEAVLNAIPDYIIFKDRHSAFQLCNKPVLQLFGVSSIEQLVGKTDFDFFEPELAHRFRSEEIEAMETGQPVLRRRWTETAHRSLWEEAIKMPLRDDTGEIIGVLSVGRDITEQVKTEQERQEQQRMLQAIMDTTLDTFALVDCDSVYRLCDKRFAELVGRPVEQIVGKSVFDLWPEQVAKTIRDEDMKVLETGGQLTVEHAFRTPDGVRWYEVSKMPMRDEAGEIIGVVSSGHDITAQRQMQHRLSAERERLDVTLRSIGDGVVTTDTDGNITLINPVAEALTGWGHDEALGRPLGEIFHIINEETGEPAENPVEKVLQTGEIVTMANHTLLIARDGSQRVVADSGAPIRDSRGHILGVVLVFRDVTERQRLEWERDEQQRMLRAVLDGSPDIIFFKDRDSVYRLCNKSFAQFHRRSVEEIVGKRPEEIWPAELTQKFREEDLRVLAGEQITVENFLPMPWGDFWYESVKSPLRDETGEIIGLVSLERDVTQRKQMEASLHESQQSLAALMSNLPGLAYRRQNDELWTMEFVSEGCLALTGYEPFELLNNQLVSYTQLIHPGDRDEVRAKVQRALEEHQPFQLTYRIITADGETRWVLEQGREVPSVHEGHEHIEGLIIDITERIRAEEQLGRQTSMLQTLLDTTSDIIIFKDRRSRFVAASKVIADILKHSQEQLVGKTDFDLFPVDQAQVFWDEEQSLMASATPLLTEHELTMPDGTYRWFEVVKKPVLDAAGNVIGLLSSEHDVTERKRMEEALVQERNLLRTLIDALPDYVYVKDRDGRLVLTNIAQAHGLGFAEPSQCVGKTDFDLYPAPLATRIWDNDQRVIKAGAMVSEEEESVTPDGETRWVWSVKAPLRAPNGEVIGLVGLSRDITERKEMEQQLAAERNLLRTVIDNIPDFIFAKDTELQMTLNNVAHAAALGQLRPEDLLGKTDFDFFEEEQARQYYQADRLAIETGQITTEEETYIDPTGEMRWLVTTRAPLRDVEGDIIGVVGISHDVTESKRSQEELRRAHDELEVRVQERTADLAIANVKLQVEINERKEAEAELQWQYHQAERSRSETSAILDATGEAMVLISPERWILTINRRFTEFFGLSQTEMIGNRFDDLRAEIERIFDDPAGLIALIMASSEDMGRQFTQPLSQRWPVRRELELYSTPVRTGEGQFLGRLFVFRDVTHEREVDRMKTEFVSLVSHELRTPLTSIKGYVDLLLGSKVGELDKTQLKFLNVVKNNTERLVSLINDLLDISRIESGKIELKQSALDMGRMVIDVTNTLQPQLQEKRQKLALEIAPGLPTVWADADRVTVILTNLLSNAHKYTPEGGQITLRVYQSDLMVRVDVQDTGIGMSPEEKSKLFTKFFRSDNLLIQETVGSGLGLVITKSLVEMQGGDIFVETERGMGSTFSFTLPTSPQVDRRFAIGQAWEQPPGQENKRVLVVDDEPDIAELLRFYLERSGYEVLVAHTGTDAFTLAQTESPDLITLDILLPDADGFTVLEWLKSDELTKEIPVVLISILPDDGHGKMLGAVEYLTKPITEADLLMHVSHILGVEQGYLILLAEDDTDTRQLMSQQLKEAGYQVIEAQNGTEAIELARMEHPDLLLLDIKMPVTDGITALRELRQNQETQHMAIIMMTASPGLLEVSQSTTQALGVAALLRKPFTVKELVEAIEQSLKDRPEHAWKALQEE